MSKYTIPAAIDTQFQTAYDAWSADRETPQSAGLAVWRRRHAAHQRALADAYQAAADALPDGVTVVWSGLDRVASLLRQEADAYERKAAERDAAGGAG